MLNEYVTKKELELPRTPCELWDWLIQKVDEIFTTDEGKRTFRLQNDNEGLIKKLVEEVRPLAIFGKLKFGDTEQVLLQPIIGDQNYDAKIIDNRTEPTIQTYAEITQAHEGKDNYWRRLELLRKGMAFSKAPVIKIDKGKYHQILIPAEATPVEEGVNAELRRIVNAAKRKAGKDYPADTSLIIFFDDTTLNDERLNILYHSNIDAFVKKEIINLDLRFATLCLVGKAKEVFREYPIKRQS